MNKKINVGIIGWLVIVLTVAAFLLLFPLSFLWASVYGVVIWAFVKTQKTMLDKGVMVIFSGAIIAVAGKALILATVDPVVVSDSYEIIESLFQMMMLSGGLGGGLISLHVIKEEKNAKRAD
ncbi:hypothetical protein CS022_19975 [Veronia nyctiphanis]|uniref:Uncharacterized protein n=1 Tax=Veronia nyctiphanis TaxID=1278244 RepID=A0A4V1LSH6_9GAMM|nr:hypothetical protein [Veronia nyctiphanis]RXJ71728.1 hypothetical protein CS022_19975 [Veronia nyctiphanis]